MQMAIVQKGLSPGQEILQRSNGELHFPLLSLPFPFLFFFLSASQGGQEAHLKMRAERTTLFFLPPFFPLPLRTNQKERRGSRQRCGRTDKAFPPLFVFLLPPPRRKPGLQSQTPDLRMPGRPITPFFPPFSSFSLSLLMVE